jgi:hypothetical protein
MKYNSIIKRNELMTCNILDHFPENYTERKKQISKGHILYNFVYVTFSNDKIIEIENRGQAVGG